MSRRQTLIIGGIVALGGLLLAAVAFFTVKGIKAPMAGVSVPQGTALIEAVDQDGVTSGISIKRVVSPEKGWLVVSAELPNKTFSPPIALVAVKKGETRDIPITLYGTGVMPASTVPSHVKLSLLVDRGRAGQLDQNEEDPAAALDKPFLQGGKAVTATIALKPYGVQVPAGTAVIEGARLLPGGRALTIDHVAAPAPSIIVVTSGGAQFADTGVVVATKSVPAGDSRNVVIELSKRPADLALIATLFTRGSEGTAAEGYMTGGTIVATPVSTR